MVLPARTAHLLGPANAFHGAGSETCVLVRIYSKSVTVNIHANSLWLLYYMGVLIGPTASHHVSRASDCPTHVRHQGWDISVIRVQAPPPPPGAAVCANLTSVSGPDLPLVAGHIAPGPAVPHFVCGPDERPSRPVWWP